MKYFKAEFYKGSGSFYESITYVIRAETEDVAKERMEIIRKKDYSWMNLSLSELDFYDDVAYLDSFNI